MAKKALTLSVIIPVYNEEHHIDDCLKSIARQKIQPQEVIVVDNNCTDQTLNIARKYSFVTIISQSKQGISHARSAGLNYAKGEILARIDADVRLDDDWSEQLLLNFYNQSTDAVSGVAHTKTSHLNDRTTTWWSRLYMVWAKIYFGTNTLWGANMALRRRVWQDVFPYLCHDDQIVHEDIDLGLVLAARGYKIVNDRRLLVSTEGSTYNRWEKLIEYTNRRNSTKYYHQQAGSYQTIKTVNPLFRAAVYTIGVVPLTIWYGHSFIDYYLRKGWRALAYYFD